MVCLSQSSFCKNRVSSCEVLGTVSRVEEVLYGSALPENLPLVPLYSFSPAKYLPHRAFQEGQKLEVKLELSAEGLARHRADGPGELTSPLALGLASYFPPVSQDENETAFSW